MTTALVSSHAWLHQEQGVRVAEPRDRVLWVIEELKNNGWTTARSVLEAPREMLIKNADLEEETVDEVLSILRQEFPDEEEEENESEK